VLQFYFSDNHGISQEAIKQEEKTVCCASAIRATVKRSDWTTILLHIVDEGGPRRSRATRTRWL